MSEPSSPEEAAEALWRLYWQCDRVDALKAQLVEFIRDRDRLIRAEERERCARIADRYDEHSLAKHLSTLIRIEEISDSEELS